MSDVLAAVLLTSGAWMVVVAANNRREEAAVSYVEELDKAARRIEWLEARLEQCEKTNVAIHEQDTANVAKLAAAFSLLGVARNRGDRLDGEVAVRGPWLLHVLNAKPGDDLNPFKLPSGDAA